MTILSFINRLRRSDEYIKHIYSQGGCYQFHLVLKHLFPECEPCINHTNDHVATLYKGKLYDIFGLNKSGNFRLMTAAEEKMARKWSFADRNLLKLTECPYCEESITF